MQAPTPCAHITKSIQRGPACYARAHGLQQDGGENVWEGSEGEHTLSARFSYTLVSVSVAVPSMRSPPPCKQNIPSA